MSNARNTDQGPTEPTPRSSRARRRIPFPSVRGGGTNGATAATAPLALDTQALDTHHTGLVSDPFRTLASVPGHLASMPGQLASMPGQLASMPGHIGKTAKGALTPARKAIAHASHSLTPKPTPEPEPPVLTNNDAEILRAVQEELQILARTVRDRRVRRRLNAARDCLNEVGKETKSSSIVPRRSRNRDSLARLQHVRAMELQRKRNPLNPLRYPGYMKFAISKI